MLERLDNLGRAPSGATPSLAVIAAALACGGLACAAPTIALAQARQASEVEGVVVTAGKRQTKLIETPMSVTVIEAATLTATGADDFAGFAKLVPGLSYVDSGPGNKRYALRGLQSAGEPEVSLYYDEIPISGVPGGSLDTGDSQPDLKLWDVDRVEVLQGPQGTLYGNGSMGGAIRIISKRPVLGRFQAATQAAAAVTDGGDPSWRLNGMINVPIGDKAAVRVAAYDRHEGGWIDDANVAAIKLPQPGGDNMNWEHTWGGRASVSVQPTPRWTLTAIGYYQSLKTGASSELYPGFASGANRFVSQSFVRTPWRDTSQMYNLISTTDLGFAEAVVTASYQKRQLHRVADTTRYLLGQFGCTVTSWGNGCTTPPIVPAGSYADESVKAWSGEARLTSKTPGPLQWTLGVFAQDADTGRRGQVAATNAAGYVEFDAAGNALHRLFARDNVDSFDQSAVFGEATYTLLPRLSATVGLRWFQSDRSDQQTVVQQFFPSQPTGAQPFQRFKESGTFKKFELSYSLGPRGLVYVQAAQGFRAGGPNFPGGFNLSAPPYEADSIWDYEAGWKLSLNDERLYWDGAVFDMEWDNLQQLVPTALFSYIANAGKARSQGFESRLTYTPTPALTVTAGAAYNNAHLVGPQPPQTNPTLQLQAGDRLANVPDWTLNSSLTWRRDLAGGYVGSARLDGAYQSDRGSTVSARSPSYFKIKAYTLVDLHLALQSPAGWRLALDVNNLFNRFAGLSGKVLDAGAVPTVTAARPRTIGVSVLMAY